MSKYLTGLSQTSPVHRAAADSCPKRGKQRRPRLREQLQNVWGIGGSPPSALLVVLLLAPFLPGVPIHILCHALDCSRKSQTFVMNRMRAGWQTDVRASAAEAMVAHPWEGAGDGIPAQPYVMEMQHLIPTWRIPAPGIPASVAARSAAQRSLQAARTCGRCRAPRAPGHSATALRHFAP